MRKRALPREVISADDKTTNIEDNNIDSSR